MNYLYYGDNLDILRTKIPTESVDLCYIDPPFNSKRNYFQIYNNQGTEDRAQSQAFIDTWEWGEEAIAGFDYINDISNQTKFTSQTVALIRGLEPVLGRGDLFAYLVHMTLRIVEIHRVLKRTGSFFLHCDATASHYLKLILDSVFCGNGGEYRNEIIWAYDTGATPKGTKFLKKHDIIFWYSKSVKDVCVNELFRKHVIPQEDLKRYKKDQDGRLWRDNPVGDYSQNSIEALEKKGLIHYTKNGKPRIKMYLECENGVYFKYKKIPDYWDDIDALNANAAERLGYPTQKPELLLERIISACSNEGDTILDAYCGCGTTIAVAQKLKRRWIGIDITYQSISLILKRLQDTYPKKLKKIESSLILDGVPRDLNSAIALANRKDDKTRKEFEKWAILTYSNNQARINDKKGADGGIDGVSLFVVYSSKNGKAVFQVKSGSVNRATIATLNSDRLREKAEIGILICLNSPTKPMQQEAIAAGIYKHPLLNRQDNCIQIVTVPEILAGKRLDLPMGRTDTIKTAMATNDQDQQIISFD
ncbi:site-specific DNA-methyltransferase (adenine-specific) [Allochromatium warmingii]|uniref:Site-specific DNA-methyltransferase (Adenine-specific) n=1 Tax=Allochromatium warmingii TaxID=61595 RepID=A0A1H3FCX9_ALLWA|nr:DNA methyltransferase [Allochromatium warmingii]SDX88836.1 site-specific DNA-methyltransferase (adenine-specific) [Allochromatium warmingii]